MSQTDVDEVIEEAILTLQGWCTIEKAKRMAAIARGASLCVELGVFGGRGLASMALALRDQGFGQAHGIDPFTPSASLEGTNDPANDEWWANLDYESLARGTQEAIYLLELTSHAQLIRMRSQDVVGFYKDGTVDVLHQDSNHSEENTTQEVMMWAPKIRPGGYWIFDDTSWPTTQKAQGDLEARGFELIEKHENWKVYRRPTIS